MATSVLIQPDVRNAMIARLLEEGTSTKPVQHWAQGAARLAQALSGGMQLQELEREGREAPLEALRLWQQSQQPQQQHPLGPVTAGPRPASAPPSMAPLAPPMMPNAAPSDDPTMSIPQSQIQRVNQQAPASFNERFSAAYSAPPARAQGAPSPMPPAPMGAMPPGGAPPALPMGQPPMQGGGAPQPNTAAIQQMLQHPNARVRAFGTQLMQGLMKENELKSVVAGDRAFTFNPRTGAYTAGPDATKATDDQRNLDAENATRAARGLPQLSLVEFEAAKKSAVASGQGQGEAQSALESMRSKMPGLESVVKQLDDLSKKATFTFAGQAVDIGRRQAGMDPREAAVARVKYISMVDNQVLPLLRDTFGAAFTQKEGDTLRATLGNPDLSPQEKQAVLKSFIEQKRRDIEALNQRLGVGTQSPQSSPQSQETRAIGGKTYVKINGQWFEQ